MSDEGLKPCPFCWSTKTKITGLEVGTKRYHWVYCESCECNGPAKNTTREAAAATWNKRTTGE